MIEVHSGIRVSAISLFVILLVISQARSAASQQSRTQVPKPVREEAVFVSYVKPPDTVEEMVSASAAVVVAEWTGRSRLVVKGISDDGIPVAKITAYTFRILDTLKLDPLLPFAGDEIEFRVLGGEEELPTLVERTKNLDALDFLPNHRYLMFIGLTVNELYLKWGPLGMYDVTSPTVTSLSRRRGAATTVGVPIRSLMRRERQ